MRERQNKPGKSGQYSKPGRVIKSEKPSFKKSAKPSGPGFGSKNRDSGSPYRKRSEGHDPNELAPPRFLKKRDSAYGSERRPEKGPFRGHNDDKGPEKRRAYGDKPAGSKRYGDKPYGEKPSGSKRYGDKPYGDKPAGSKRYGDKPSGDKPYRDRPASDRPFRERSESGFKGRSGKPEGLGNAPFREKSSDGYKGKTGRTPRSEDRFAGDNEKKPFRPKYDPQVPTKKSYSTRKKELLDIKEDADDIRLNKFIANAGICSRREADDIISQGLVTVNGEVIAEMGYRVKKGDTVRYDGRKILPEPFVYILMNKPKDFITTTDDEKGRKTVMDLLAGKVSQRVYPIGRLDRNTTGVLLLTNDGDVAQAMTHPSFNIKKVYHVVLDKKVSGSDLDKLVEGVELEDGVVHADAAAFVDNEDRRHVGVEIHSGKNRVVRRMFEALDYEVEKLDRVSMGIFTKKDLPRGKWRFLSDSEIAHLQKLKS